MILKHLLFSKLGRLLKFLKISEIDLLFISILLIIILSIFDYSLISVRFLVSPLFISSNLENTVTLNSGRIDYAEKAPKVVLHQTKLNSQFFKQLSSNLIIKNNINISKDIKVILTKPSGENITAQKIEIVNNNAVITLPEDHDLPSGKYQVKVEYQGHYIWTKFNWKTQSDPLNRPKEEKIASSSANVQNVLNQISLNNTDAKSGEVSIESSKNSSELTEKRIKLSKQMYKTDEKIELNLGVDRLSYYKSIQVKDFSNRIVPVSTEENIDNNQSLVTFSVPKSSRPGKFKVFAENQYGRIETHEFIWGVLVVNTNKSYYQPGEPIFIQMASLDEDGHTLCDSHLKLEVTNFAGEKASPSVQTSASCQPENVTDNPDYFANYVTSGSGTYTMVLTNPDKNYSISDTFEVADNLPFSVERIGATRINPFKSAYTMRIEIKANQDFNGQIKEKLPKDFAVNNLEGAQVNQSETGEEIVWNLHLNKGDEKDLQYTYQAPLISPEIFTLGPLSIEDQGKLLFTESRQWQLASDANTVPAWSVVPVENPASYATTPTNVGAAVTFQATATDANSDQYYLAVCKTNAITANKSAAPTCGGGSWCVSAAANSGVQASCSYTTLAGDAESDAWYGFACDRVSTGYGCTAVSQGSGNAGSPFNVNHVPTFTIMNVNSTVDPGATLTWTSTASDPDVNTTPDTVTLYVCKTSGFNGSACTGQEWCHSIASSSNPSCTSTAPLSGSSILGWGYIVDNHGLAATGGFQGMSQPFSVNNKTPVLSGNIAENPASGVTPTNVGSTVTFQGTATDANGGTYYMAICKSAGVTANVSGGNPTCTGGNWCIGNATSGSQASCSYTTLAGDAESDAWYGYVCDSGTGATCSAVNQGSGDSGAPFVVNHRPSFSSVGNNGPQPVGGTITWTTTSSDSDTNGSADTVSLFVCKGNDFTGTACGATGTWCSVTGASSNPTCNITAPSAGTYNAYVYVIDNHNFAASGGSQGTNSSFTTTPPPITLSGKIYTNETGTLLDCSTSRTVNIRVNGGGSYTTECSNSPTNGSWSLSASVTSGQTVVAYLDNETEKASTVIVSDGTAQSNINLYQNVLVLRDDSNGSITNAEIGVGETGDAQNDDLFTITGGDLTVANNTKTLVYTSDTFIPGGSVTTPSLEVVGTYNGGTYTLNLTGTGSSTTCTDPPGTVMPFCITGTFTPSPVNYTGDGATAVAATTYSNLQIGNATTQTSNRIYTLTGDTTVMSVLTIGPTSGSYTQTLAASNRVLNLYGSGTPFVINSKGSFDAGTSTVKYMGTGSGGTLNLAVTSSSNDASQDAGATASVGSQYGYLGTGDGSNVIPNTIGVRFINVTIPRGAVISSAVLKLRKHTTESPTIYCNWYGNNVDNAAAFTNGEYLNTRDQTTAYVIENESRSLTDSIFYSFPTSGDWKNIVQEIVNRPGWASGNAMVFTCLGGSSIHDYQYTYVDFYDESPTAAPTLDITYVGGVNVTATTYNNLELSPTSNGTTHTLATAGSQTLTVNGDFTIGDGTHTVSIDATSYDPTLDINGNMIISTGGTFQASDTANFTIAKDFTNNGTFTHNNGTVTFDSLNTSKLNYSGNTTFYNLTVPSSSAGKQVQFDETQATIVTHNLDIQGTNCTTGRIFLSSVVGGNTWDLTVTGATVTLAYINVTDGNATPTTVTANNSTQTGSNPGWTINSGACSSITLSGTVFTNEGSSNIGSGKAVRLKVNNGTAYDTSTSSGGGWSVSLPGLSSGQTVLVYLYGITEKASIVLVSDGSAKSDIDLYQNRVILRDDANGSITNTEIGNGDTADSDDLVTVSSGNLVVSSGYETHIYSGNTFAPGGNVDTGKLHIPSSSIYSGSSETLTLTGSGTGTSRPLYIESGTYTTPAITVFSGTSNSDIDAASYNTLMFFPSSGTQTYAINGGILNINSDFSTNGAGSLIVDAETNDPTIDVNGNFSIASGHTIQASSTANFTIAGNFTDNGNFIPNSGVVTLDGSGNVNLNSGCTNVSACPNQLFNQLKISKDISSNTVTLTNNLSLSDTLTINTGILNQGSNHIRSVGSSAVSIGSGGTWQNLSTGDIYLGGSLVNSGTLTFKGNNTCGASNDIVISAISGTPSWSGFGIFDISDASISNQNATVNIDTYSSTNGGGNTGLWKFYPGCDNGSLAADFVDSFGFSLSSPVVTLNTKPFNFLYQTSDGVLGTNDTKMRTANSTADAAWSLTIAATSGPTALWSNGTSDYDFNDPQANAADGSDSDGVGGQLTLDPFNLIISPQSGCNSIGLSKGSSAAFNEITNTNSITLVSAGSTSQLGCYWDLTGIDLLQTIPAQQVSGNYSIDMTITVTAF